MSGRAIRLSRILRPPARRAVVVPLDHSFSDGPVIPTATGLAGLVGALGCAGADAVVLHKGRLRSLQPALFADLSVIVHLSGGTRHCVEAGSKVLVGGVEEAVAAGADAVSVHVNIGAPSEAHQLRDLGQVTAEAAHLGVPVLAMMYARGEAFAADRDPDLAVLAHLAAVATDAGADVVKLSWPGSTEALAEVTASSSLPVLVAGGPPRADDDTVDLARRTVAAGAAGLAVGRGVFTSPDPATLVRRLREVVHCTGVDIPRGADDRILDGARRPFTTDLTLDTASAGR